MKAIAIILLTVATVFSAEFPHHAPKVIELRDQFDHAGKISFPSTNIIFLVIGDRQGSEQIPPWTAVVKQQFSNTVSIRGIADVSSVPKPLRGFVRNKYQKAQPHPVMMDWTGEVVKAFVAVEGKANIFVLGQQGEILHRYAGPASEKNVTAVYDVIKQALKSSVPKPNREPDATR